MRIADAIMGVDKEVESAALQKAYKKLALKLHPDKCSLDGATDAFKKVGAAGMRCCTHRHPRRALTPRTRPRLHLVSASICCWRLCWHSSRTGIGTTSRKPKASHSVSPLLYPMPAHARLPFEEAHTHHRSTTTTWSSPLQPSLPLPSPSLLPLPPAARRHV